MAFTVKLNGFSSQHQRLSLIELTRSTIEDRPILGDRQSLNRLINTVGIEIPRALDDDFCRPILDYHLALLCAEIDLPELATKLIQQSGSLPTMGKQLFFDAERSSRDIEDQRADAARRGLPSFFMSCMPRAASASLTQTIAATLNMPRMRLSIGSFPNTYLVAPWLQHYMLGGGMMHDHFGASLFNLGVMRDAGLRSVFVLIRDPRAAALSYVNLVSSGLKQAEKQNYEEKIQDAFHNSYIPWLRGWIRAEQADDFDIVWIDSKRVRGADSHQVYHDILAKLAVENPALRPFVDGPFKTVRANYVKGTDDEWRRYVCDCTAAEMFDEIPDRVIDLLSLVG